MPGRHGHCGGTATSLPRLGSLLCHRALPRAPQQIPTAAAWHSGPLSSQPHGRAAPRSPAALASSGSGPLGSTCTRSWVRRRTREPKTAPRLVARRGGSTLSRYSLSSQARGLTPWGSARPTRLRAGCLSLGHGAGGPGRVQGTWAGDALHQGVHQGLPARPAQGPGRLVVRKEAVGKALLVPQRPVQPATATGQHTELLGTCRQPGGLPQESRVWWSLPALPLARHEGSAAQLAPSSQGPSLPPGPARTGPWGPHGPHQTGGLCGASGHEILPVPDRPPPGQDAPAPAGHLSG